MRKISCHANITNPETNGYPYIECLKSYLAFADEIVLVDGGTTDGSLEKIQALSPNIRIIEGLKWEYDFDWTILCRNLNTGFQACEEGWTFKFDLDYIFPEWEVEKLRKAVESASHPLIWIGKWNFTTIDRCYEKDYYLIHINNVWHHILTSQTVFTCLGICCNRLRCSWNALV